MKIVRERKREGEEESEREKERRHTETEKYYGQEIRDVSLSQTTRLATWRKNV